MTIPELVELVKQYENDALPIDGLDERVITAGFPPIDRGFLDSYSKSYSVEEFADLTLTKPLEDWGSIDDQRALELIREALENEDKGVYFRNLDALDLRYKLGEGTAMSLFIDQPRKLGAEEILELIKKGSVTVSCW